MQTPVFTLDQIKAVLPDSALPALIDAVAESFIAYSSGQALVPPPAHLDFDTPPRGDVHLKYGYISGDPYYVIKVASGFYANPQRGLPSSGGLMLAFQRETGQLAAVLLDEGWLTDLRTAAAGAVAARALAPRQVRCIGMVGAGTQARLQLQLLRHVTGCREVLVWGRDRAKLAHYAQEMAAFGFAVEPTLDIEHLGKQCNLIVTTTPARTPLLSIGDLAPGAGLHITAVGADGGGKQELAPLILQQAQRVVADSIAQCSAYGEISHALRGGLLRREKILELGSILNVPELCRTDETQLTVADLTGVAVQDIAITKFVTARLLGSA